MRMGHCNSNGNRHHYFGNQNNYKARNSAGSSSNISSSNSNNSDGFNSLDSIEHDMSRTDTQPKYTADLPTDSLSYLGPFNFRQLLRPIQGPTNSLRKRKQSQLFAVKPCPI